MFATDVIFTDKETTECLDSGGNSQPDIERDPVYLQKITFYEPGNGAPTPEPGGISGKVNIIEPDARRRARTYLE